MSCSGIAETLSGKMSIDIQMTDQSRSASRLSHALAVEKLARAKAVEEINEEAHRAAQQAVSDCAARGILQSGIFGGRIVRVQQERAKRIIDKEIELSRATRKNAPELATEDEFNNMLESANSMVDRVLASIPEYLKRHGFQVATDASKADEFEAYALKAHARREIELLKHEHELEMIRQEERMPKVEAKDKRKVWVVHGRNLKARDAMFAFLRAIGLEPMEWGEVLALTGKSTLTLAKCLTGRSRRHRPSLSL